MKLIQIPLALVGQLVLVIVEFSEAMHLIVLPLSFVIATILIVKFTFAVPHPILLIAFVPAATLVFLHKELELFLVVCRIL